MPSDRAISPVTSVKILALREERASPDVQGEILVTESEPRLAAELRERLHEVPRLVGATPAGLGVGGPGQRVGQRVHVGADVEAQVVEIVARVDDENEFVRIENAGQPERQLGAADTAGECQHGHRNRSSSKGRTIMPALSSVSLAGNPRTSAAGVRSVVSPMASVAAAAMLSARLTNVTLSSRP